MLLCAYGSMQTSLMAIKRLITFTRFSLKLVTILPVCLKTSVHTTGYRSARPEVVKSRFLCHAWPSWHHSWQITIISPTFPASPSPSFPWVDPWVDPWVWGKSKYSIHANYLVGFQPDVLVCTCVLLHVLVVVGWVLYACWLSLCSLWGLWLHYYAHMGMYCQHFIIHLKKLMQSYNIRPQ